ncbi:kinase-like domain-containing protein [Chytridium lagenaria]|nr:kinase-like domain-containing protein [Chytridium lagenaria]
MQHLHPSSAAVADSLNTPTASRRWSFQSFTSIASSRFIARYDVQDVIGTGSFATVRRVVRRSDGAVFAVRILDKQADGDGSLKDIQQEISILNRIQHVGIITLVALYESPHEWFIITELAEGGELFDRIREKGPLSERSAALIMRQLLHAIAHLHSEGKRPPPLTFLRVVHRDLKPENIFAAYLSPEALKEGGYGRPADVWALGCGYQPFWSERQYDIFIMVMNGRYEFDEQDWSSVSLKAKAFVSRMLTVNPAKRPTAQDMLQDPWLMEALAQNYRTVSLWGFFDHSTSPNMISTSS